MTFDEYQKFAKEISLYRETIRDVFKEEHFYLFPAIGLAGETGEVMEKIKKVVREKKGIVDEKTREELVKEMGDVLWYLAMLAEELNMPLSKVVEVNVQKLTSRKDKGILHGSGDNR